MKKTARLDKIFLKLGTATEDQITRAVARQKTSGGRLGENLVELGVITEAQLLSALSEQFRIPTATPVESDIAKEVLARLPAGVINDDLILPLAWDEESKTLTLAVADPASSAAMLRAKNAMAAERVRIVLASEHVIADLGLRVLSGEGADPEGVDGPRIELPELFQAEEPEEAESVSEDPVPADRKILMVSRGAPMKNFLPPVFLREGAALAVTSLAAEAAEEMAMGHLESILVAGDMAEVFSAWVKAGEVPEPEVDVTIFPSVSESLAGNPVGYDSMIQSLRAGVQALADFRCAHYGSCPPYGLIVHDLEYLSTTHRLSRVARDGLHLAAHLLLPAQCEYSPDPVGSEEPFQAFSSSLELATRIRFPWRLDALLDACHALFSGRVTPEKTGKWSREVHRAAQLLAIVWFRHNHVRLAAGDEEEAMISLRAALREKAGKLATLDVIESYLGLVQERGGAMAVKGPRKVLLVGGERISRALSPELSRLGVQVSQTGDLADAQKLAESDPPGAVVVDESDFPEEVGKFARMVRLDSAVPLYVLTDSTDPTLVLNLLDIGANDVFGPTHEFDLMAARLNHAIRNHIKRAGTETGAGQFSATFEVFSFLDLIQTLGHGQKSVRIDLTNESGGKATLFMEGGRLIHGVAGKHTGPEAVYAVITWEDEGEFTVQQEEDFPSPTIQESVESLLMEGCRRLDEDRR